MNYILFWSSLFYNTSARQERQERDTNNTSAKRVQNDGRVRHERHKCDKNAAWTTRVRHECYTSVTQTTRVKSFEFDKNKKSQYVVLLKKAFP